MFGKVQHSNRVDIAVENLGGGEKTLRLVLFLLVQVKDLLDSIRAIVRVDDSIPTNLLSVYSILHHALFVQFVKIIDACVLLLGLPHAFVARLSVFRVMLILGTSLFTFIEVWIFVHNILHVKLRDILRVVLNPAFIHDL